MYKNTHISNEQNDVFSGYFIGPTINMLKANTVNVKHCLTMIRQRPLY